MEIPKAISENITTSISENIILSVGVLIAALTTAVIAFLRKLPSVIIEEYWARRHERILDIEGGTNVIMSKLRREGHGIFYHIVKYSDSGEALEKGEPVYIKATWEEIGDPCKYCDNPCFLKDNIKSQLPDWGGGTPTTISGNWYGLTRQTIKLRGGINTTDIIYLDDINREIWKKAGIQYYKEVLVKNGSKGWKVIGVSYCKGMKKNMKVDNPLIFRSAKKLRSLYL